MALNRNIIRKYVVFNNTLYVNSTISGEGTQIEFNHYHADDRWSSISDHYHPKGHILLRFWLQCLAH